MNDAYEVSVTALRTFALCAHLSEPALRTIAQRASRRLMARNDIVVRTGEPVDSVYLVLSGTLKARVGDGPGRELILSMLGPGEVFGEMSVLDDKPCAATVLCVNPGTLVVVRKNDFMRCLREHFVVTQHLMARLVHRLRHANRRIESLALMDVYGRVARLLLDMAQTIDGQPTIKGRISRQDMARMVGASREMVSRVMSELRLNGLIEEKHGRIVLQEAPAHRTGTLR